tara:strand:- start:1169 stop:1858 length:690 start_codon:yes stop_codon:yes gene_type:complete
MKDENPYSPPSADLDDRGAPSGKGGKAMNLDYPLEIKFKLIALASQFWVTDARGNVKMYVKQKAFKLKEDIRVFSDDRQDNLLYQIKANKIIDFSASYKVTAADGHDVGVREIGVVRRKGMRSIFKATYEVCRGDTPILIIQEANAWIKVLDALLQQIPIIGMFAGYFFNPTYDLKAGEDAPPVLQAHKQPAFFESKFSIERTGNIEPEDEELSLMGLVVMLLLERARG